MRCLKQAWPWKNECLGTRTSRTQTNHFTFYGPWLENNTPKVDIERFRNTAKIQSKFCLIIAWLASTVSFIVATHIVQKDAKLTSNAGSFGIGFTSNAPQGYSQTSKMEPRSTQRPAQMHPERHLKTTKMNPQDSKIHPFSQSTGRAGVSCHGVENIAMWGCTCPAASAHGTAKVGRCGGDGEDCGGYGEDCGRAQHRL